MKFDASKTVCCLKFVVVDDISDGASDPATVSSLCEETTCSRREYKSILLIFEFYYGFYCTDIEHHVSQV